jgi:hypothetical protein
LGCHGLYGMRLFFLVMSYRLSSEHLTPGWPLVDPWLTPGWMVRKKKAYCTLDILGRVAIHMIWESLLTNQ